MAISPAIEARIDEIYEEWSVMLGFDDGCALGCAYWYLAAARSYQEAGNMMTAAQYASLATATALLRIQLPGHHGEHPGPLP
jgi:hypothetical protein